MAKEALEELSGCVLTFYFDWSPERMLFLLPDGPPYCHYPYDMISKHAFHVYTSDLCLVDLQRRMRNEVLPFPLLVHF